MDSPYLVWALCKGFHNFSDDEEIKVKRYFSSEINGGGEMHTFEKEESPYGILLRIEYKETGVVGQVLERNHNLGSIINSNSDEATAADFPLLLSSCKSDLAMTCNQITEADEEHMDSFIILDSGQSIPAVISPGLSSVSSLQLMEKVEGEICAQKEQLTDKVVVEVYEFPNKPIDDLVDELPYHFSIDPFNAATSTRHDDMYDSNSKTFKLEFSKSDAEKILQSELQYLLGEETEKIKLRLLEPEKSCAVLLTCEVKLASEKVIRTEMNKFGKVEEVRKMDSQKHLVTFHQPEAAMKAADARAIKITGKQVTITLWNEPSEKFVPEVASCVPPPPIVSETNQNKVLVSCEGISSPKVVETALKVFGKITKCTKCDEPNSFLVEFSQSAEAYKAAAQKELITGKKSFCIKLHEERSSKTAVVEVYKFPDKPIGALLDELEFHFSIDPFNAATLTSHADMYDKSSRTFKLEFSESDAEKILQTKEQNLLGEENQKIRLRLFDPQKPRAVLLASEVKIVPKKVIRTGMYKFGEVQEVRQMDSTAQKYLVTFHHHEAADKAAKARSVRISGKQVTLSLWSENLEKSETAVAPTAQSSPAVVVMNTRSVLVTCEEATSPKVVETVMKTYGTITKCVTYDQPNTFLVEFAESSDAYKTAAQRIVRAGRKSFSIKVHEGKPSNTGDHKDVKYNTPAAKLSQNSSAVKISEKSLAVKLFEKSPAAKISEKSPAAKPSENSVLLVSNLSDVDNRLLAHWVKTVTGIWPTSCHINDTKEKAVVKMPSTIDMLVLSKTSEEDYFLHGVVMSAAVLQPTTKMLAEFNKDVHQDAVRLYFSSPECGLRNGQITSVVPHSDSRKAFIITYSKPKAIQEIIQRVSHSFMDYRIEVGEYYPTAGYCKPRDCFVFPSRKPLPVTNVARLVVKNCSFNERKYFEMLMANQRLSGGDKSAKISYSENLAYVCYNDPKMTNAVFEKCRKDGIFLNDKRLEMDLETTELTSAHDPKAVRLSGLPQNIDPDRLKFYLSDISGNLVTSMLFNENGDRAVAYFKDNIDMPSLYSVYQSVKLDQCERMRIQPELRSNSIKVSALTPNINQSYLELVVDDILSHSHTAKVEQSNDVQSTWIVSACHADIEVLSESLLRDKDLGISKYSEFLGVKVTNGIHRKTFSLSEIVQDQFLLQFLLDDKLPGYKSLENLIQKYGCYLSANGEVTMEFDSLQYMISISKWKELKDNIAKDSTNSWCVDMSVHLSKDMYTELSPLLLSYKSNLKIDRLGEKLIFAGEKQQVKETVLMVSQAIRDIEERKREESETRKEVMNLKGYEAAYLDISNVLSEVKGRYPVKELSLDISKQCVIIRAHNKYFHDIQKEITEITSSLCESSASKSYSFIQRCKSEVGWAMIQENIKAHNLLAVCVPDGRKLTAYAKTKETAQMALKSIDEVVWETKYPEGRTFNEEEKKFLLQNQPLYERAKNEIITKNPSVDIIQTLEDTNFVVTGCGKGNHSLVLKQIDEFFDKSLTKSTTFAGNGIHITYIIRYMMSELKLIEQTTNTRFTYGKGEICVSGTQDQTRNAEQQLMKLCDRIISTEHPVEVDFHIQLLLNEPDIIEDLEKACQTLIILENGEMLRKKNPESSTARDSLVLQIHISPRTILQVRKAEIHEIHDCDGLAIPTSRNLKLGDINPSFANYINNRGGSNIFEDCINSPEAVKAGKRLLPGSVVTTSAGEFSHLKTIYHMVLDVEKASKSVLEATLAKALSSAREQHVKALLIPMGSYPEHIDYYMVMESLIKVIKDKEDQLPPKVVLLETRPGRLNKLKSSLDEEFQEGYDPFAESRALSLDQRLGPQHSSNDNQMLSGLPLVINGCKFTVVKGLLQESKQQVIVNSTGSSISLQNNPLGKALSDAAGPELQVECNNLAPLNEGEVKVSKGYGLPCKRILHCRISGYYTNLQSEKSLMALMVECLRLVDQELKSQSVAFPALGTGKLNYPATVVASCMINSLMEYTSKYTVNHLSEVVVVIFPADISTYEAFVAAIEKIASQNQNKVAQTLHHNVKENERTAGAVAEKLMEDAYPKKKRKKAISRVSKEKLEAPALLMTIYGIEEVSITSTKNKLSDRLQKETVVIQWDKLESYGDERHLIANLSPEQVEYLHDEAECMGVALDLDQEVMNIQISGYKSTIYDYRDIIKTELQKVEKRSFDEKFQDFQACTVKWIFRDERKEKWSDFDWEDSHHLESNYKQNPNAVIMFFSKQFNRSLKIDLHMKSFKLPKVKFIIKRVDKAASFPKGWDESAGEQADVTLDRTSTEYQAVQANFFKTIKNPNAAILEIKRVQHLTAYKQYMEQRRLVANKLNQPEDRVERLPLWHGTTEETVHKIAKSFFNRSYSGKNATVYGKGSYFARDSSYSAQDTYSKPNSYGVKYMFQARVIVGDYTNGDSGMIDCPQKPDGTSYDSVVDNNLNPAIYVVFQDTAAYPEYIIKFRM